MVCPKCGAQVEDNATVCTSCNEALQPAAEEKKAEAKKFDLKSIDFKSPKTWLVLAGAVVALVIVIAIICGIVNALSTPDRIAESYAEAYLDGLMNN